MQLIHNIAQENKLTNISAGFFPSTAPLNPKHQLEQVEKKEVDLMKKLTIQRQGRVPLVLQEGYQKYQTFGQDGLRDTIFAYLDPSFFQSTRRQVIKDPTKYVVPTPEGCYESTRMPLNTLLADEPEIAFEIPIYSEFNFFAQLVRSLRNRRLMDELANHQQILIGTKGVQWRLGGEDGKERRGIIHVVGASVDVLGEENVSLCAFWQSFDELVWMGIPKSHITLNPRGIMNMDDGSMLLDVQAPDNVPLAKCQELQTFTMFAESKVYLKASSIISQIEYIEEPNDIPRKTKDPVFPGICNLWM